MFEITKSHPHVASTSKSLSPAALINSPSNSSCHLSFQLALSTQVPCFPGGTNDKESLANAGDARDLSSISGLERSPGVGNCKRAPIFLTGKFHGQRSLAGYRPWDCTESDLATEQ